MPERTESPKLKSETPEELADRIDRLIDTCETRRKAEHLSRIVVDDMVRDGLTPSPIVVQARERVARLSAKVRTRATDLADALERCGIDATDVLLVADGAMDGHGVGDWPQLRASLRRTAIRLRLGPVASEPAATVKPRAPTFMSAKELASRFDAPYDALRKRLKREHSNHADGFMELRNAASRGVRILYDAHAPWVRLIIDNLATQSVHRASIARPSVKH